MHYKTFEIVLLLYERNKQHSSYCLLLPHNSRWKINTFALPTFVVISKALKTRQQINFKKNTKKHFNGALVKETMFVILSTRILKEHILIDGPK